MTHPLITAFSKSGMNYQIEGSDSQAPVIYLQIECPIGSSATASFQLLVYMDAGPLGDEYVRFCITPLVERPDDSDIVHITSEIVRLNYYLTNGCLAIDNDGDLCLITDCRLDQLQSESIQRICEHMAATVGVIFSAFENGEANKENDFSMLARRFTEELDEDLALDYTPESLEAFEVNVDEAYRLFLQQENLLDANALAYGAYIGEVMVRAGGGRWETGESLEESYVVVGERRYQPVRMARAFLESERAMRPSHIVRRALAQV